MSVVPSQSAAGHMLLDWNPANPGAFYLVTISNDAEGNQSLAALSDRQGNARSACGRKPPRSGSDVLSGVWMCIRIGAIFCFRDRSNDLSRRVFPDRRRRGLTQPTRSVRCRSSSR